MKKAALTDAKHTRHVGAKLTPEQAQELRRLGGIGKVVVIKGKPARFVGIEKIDGVDYAIAHILETPEDN